MTGLQKTAFAVLTILGALAATGLLDGGVL